MGKGNIEDLVTKFAVGSNADANQTYRRVDYKELRLKLQQEKLKLHLDRQNLKKFNNVKTKYGTTSAFNQHKEVWMKEDISIKSQIRTISAVISDQADPTQLLCENEVCEFISTIQEEFRRFEANTVQPVWEFIEDMQHWLSNSDRSNASEVEQIHDSMRDRQGTILGLLSDQGHRLENDLLVFNSVLREWEAETDNVTDTLLRLKFPQESTLCEYLEAYLATDKKYNDALVELADYYSVALDKGKYGGWSREDHLLYLHVSQQYPVDKFQRSVLCLEMLRLILPDRTEVELRAHGEWVQLSTLYTEHRKTIRRMHTAALQKLVAAAQTDCKQHWAAHRDMQNKCEKDLKQKEKTARIFEDLLRLRAEKLKKLQAHEEELVEYQRKCKKERVEMERREARQRKMEKDKIQAFKELKDSKNREYQAKLVKMQERDASRKQLQLAAGKKRVEYRGDLHEKRLEEQAAAEESRREEQRKRQEVLDRLAATVVVEVPDDPARLLKETEASSARHKETEYVGINPLFKMVGYEDSVIQKDMRFKVEKALRSAGLVDTDYGRQIMKSIKPPVEPRRDMDSTVFKRDTTA